MQRTDIHTISFVARCESGLHIGGSQDELVIGGSDNPVIKNPVTGGPTFRVHRSRGRCALNWRNSWARPGGARVMRRAAALRNHARSAGCSERT